MRERLSALPWSSPDAGRLLQAELDALRLAVVELGADPVEAARVLRRLPVVDVLRAVPAERLAARRRIGVNLLVYGLAHRPGLDGRDPQRDARRLDDVAIRVLQLELDRHGAARLEHAHRRLRVRRVVDRLEEPVP